MKPITTQQAADILGVSPRRVQALVKAGRLPATKLGRDYLIDESDLEKVKDRKPGRPKTLKWHVQRLVQVGDKWVKWRYRECMISLDEQPHKGKPRSVFRVHLSQAAGLGEKVLRSFPAAIDYIDEQLAGKA